MKTAATVAIAIASIMIGKAHAADMESGALRSPPAAGYLRQLRAPTAYGNYNWSGVYLVPMAATAWNKGTPSFV